MIVGPIGCRPYSGFSVFYNLIIFFGFLLPTLSDIIVCHIAEEVIGRWNMVTARWYRRDGEGKMVKARLWRREREGEMVIWWDYDGKIVIEMVTERWWWWDGDGKMVMVRWWWWDGDGGHGHGGHGHGGHGHDAWTLTWWKWTLWTWTSCLCIISGDEGDEGDEGVLAQAVMQQSAIVPRLPTLNRCHDKINKQPWEKNQSDAVVGTCSLFSQKLLPCSPLCLQRYTCRNMDQPTVLLYYSLLQPNINLFSSATI